MTEVPGSPECRKERVEDRTGYMDQDRMYKALGSGRCIVCFLMTDDEADMLYKGASINTTIEVSETLAKNGFCRHHFWQLNKRSAYDTTSHITGYLLQKFILATEQEDRQSIDDILNQYRDNRMNTSGEIICPICETLSKLETEYINYLKTFIMAYEHVEHFRNSRGLCIPHFMRLIHVVDSASMKKELLSIQRNHITMLTQELEEYIRKHLPPLKWERTYDEKIAYYRAIEKLVGKEGVEY